jgi:NADH:ubiquinone oxidoreductase subunit 4 (subunit M)
MILISLLLIPMLGILTTLVFSSYEAKINILLLKNIALFTSIINMLVSLVIFIAFDFSSNQFQFVQEYHEVSYFDFYLGLDGLSIYFVLLTTIITPIALLSN